MSVKNLNVSDICLCELARTGSTSAPPAVLERLRASGRITVNAGKPTLTPKARKRGEALLPIEHDLRLMFATKSSGNSTLRTVGGSAIQ